jgi:hypothetical protein
MRDSASHGCVTQWRRVSHLVGDGPPIDDDGKRLPREHHAARIARGSAFQQLLKVIGAAEHGYLLTAIVDASQHRNLSACSRIIVQESGFCSQRSTARRNYLVLNSPNRARSDGPAKRCRHPVESMCRVRLRAYRLYRASGTGGICISTVRRRGSLRRLRAKSVPYSRKSSAIICHDPSRVVTICHILYNAVAKSSYEGRCVEKTDRRCCAEHLFILFCLEE